MSTDDEDEPSPKKKSKKSQPNFSTPKFSNTRSTRMNYETSYSTTENDGTPTKQLGYLQIEVANTTPIPIKMPKNSRRSAITQSPQEIHVSGKDLQKSVKGMCPTADINRLKNRHMTIDEPNTSLHVACTPGGTPNEKKGDILFLMKKKPTPLVVKQIDNSF